MLNNKFPQNYELLKFWMEIGLNGQTGEHALHRVTMGQRQELVLARAQHHQMEESFATGQITKPLNATWTLVTVCNPTLCSSII